MAKFLGAVAHDTTKSKRTLDVLLSEDTTFADMMLSEKTQNGLKAIGFVRPSPIQLSAIPVGRLGTDLIVHAKSGTGKTLVFTIIALEMIDLTVPSLQVMIVAPTREIAVQIKEVITTVGVEYKGLQVGVFIGGLKVASDEKLGKKCHIAVGTPGRLKHLMSSGVFNLNSVRLFVLDEADQFMKDSFRNDVSYIFANLTTSKQTLVVSATFPQDMEDYLNRFLVNPRRISPSADPLLLGIRHFVAVTPTHSNPLVIVKHKVSRLIKILSSYSYRQCIIFCNIQSRMEGISKTLSKEGFPVLHLSGSMPQEQRLNAVSAFLKHRCRILLTTDLAARGLDIEQVDLVLNLDLPYDPPTFLHRVGRAGRFGAAGVAVTIVNDSQELASLKNIFYEIGGEEFKAPRLPNDFTSEIWKNHEHLEMIESVFAVKKEENGHSSFASNEDAVDGSTKKKKLKSMDECKKIVRDTYLKTSTSIPMPSYSELEKRFDDFRLANPAANPNDVSKLASDLTNNLKVSDNSEDKDLDEALKLLRFDSEAESEDDKVESSDLDESYECDNEDRVPDYDSSDFESYALSESLSSEGDDIASDESDVNSPSCSDSDDVSSLSGDDSSISSSTDDESDVDSNGDFSCCHYDPNEKCKTCDRWFLRWREQLLAERNYNQQQFYLKELSKC